MNILQSDSGWASEEDKLGRFRRDCMAALYDLYTSDSLQAALTALYAKLLVIMGQQCLALYITLYIMTMTASVTL